MEQHYRLPISALVELLQGAAEPLQLEASLPSVPAVSQTACLAQLVLGQGRLCSCLIRSAQTGHVLLRNQAAYQALERSGDLDWRLTGEGNTVSERDRSLAPGGRPPLVASTIPSLRASPLTQGALAALSHQQRRVLLLVDGKRSLHEIAALLRKTPEEVGQQLRQFAAFVDL